MMPFKLFSLWWHNTNSIRHLKSKIWVFFFFVSIKVFTEEMRLKNHVCRYWCFFDEIEKGLHLKDPSFFLLRGIGSSLCRIVTSEIWHKTSCSSLLLPLPSSLLVLPSQKLSRFSSSILLRQFPQLILL